MLKLPDYYTSDKLSTVLSRGEGTFNYDVMQRNDINFGNRTNNIELLLIVTQLTLHLFSIASRPTRTAWDQFWLTSKLISANSAFPGSPHCCPGDRRGRTEPVFSCFTLARSQTSPGAHWARTLAYTLNSTSAFILELECCIQWFSLFFAPDALHPTLTLTRCTLCFYGSKISKHWRWPAKTDLLLLLWSLSTKRQINTAVFLLQTTNIRRNLNAADGRHYITITINIFV